MGDNMEILSTRKSAIFCHCRISRKYRFPRAEARPGSHSFWNLWYNKELRGLCVYVDDMEVDCTPDNFSLPLEPEEWNYQKNDQTSPEYHRDRAQWESFRDDFFLSFKTSIPDGIVGKTITLKTAVGAEASYGDLKILFDKTSESKFSGKYSKFHTKFEESRTL